MTTLLQYVREAQRYGARLRSVTHVNALALLGYRGSRDVHLDAGVRIPRPDRVTLGPGVRVSREVTLECSALGGVHEPGAIAIGERVFIGERTTIASYARISVGRGTLIAHNCSLMDSNHGTAPGIPVRDQPGNPAPIAIGADCWLGAGVVVLAGVSVGDGTIVGAGSVVTRSLPANVVAAGVPARVLRPR